MESMEQASPDRQPQLHPGFRFHPTDEELVVHYLKRKLDSVPLPVSIIAEVNLYKFDPWELPRKAIFGEKEWYFFSPRDRKYPNGARPNRAAPSGYWKATGTDKAIVIAAGARKIGVKKALVFYIGKPPKGTKTNWIMHEYRLIDGSGSSSSSKPSNGATTSKKASLRLDDWVLCRIYQKNNNQIKMAEEEREISMDTIRVPMAPPRLNGFLPIHPRSIDSFGALLENEENFLEGLLTDHDNAISHVKADAAIVLASKQDFSLVSSYNWNDSKRFQGNNDDGGGSNINGLEDMGHHHMGTVLESTAHNGSYKHNPVLGSLVEGVFRQPPYHMTGANWNS